jgi:hypothetical protein
MKLTCGLIALASVTAIELPRLTRGLNLHTEHAARHLPRMVRQAEDYGDEEYEVTIDGAPESPGMTAAEIKASEALYNKYLNTDGEKDSTPFKPMDSFLSDIFDNKRNDPAALPTEIGRNDRQNVEFQNFISRNPSGIAKNAFPTNLLTDLYDPVYEEGPLLCRKVRAHSIKKVGDTEQPIHIKPIGCCPNNEDGKPFGPGKACCCGHVYNTTSHFCCDESHGQCTDGMYHIFEDTEQNRRKCWSSQTCDREIQTNVVELTCTDSIYHGSNCDFTCPNGFDLAGIDQASCDPKTGSWNNLWGQVVEETPCCKRKCDTKDPNYKLDFFIILDQSSSIGDDNFDKMKNFVINLLLQSNLGQTGVRVGLITYNRKPQLRFHMNEMANHQQAIDAVDSIVYEGRGTNTGLAIRWVVDNAFRPEFGDRPEVPNKVLLITDGRARDPPILRVEAARLQEQATVYALGIGKQIDYVELNRIASDPSERHVLYVDNFSFLERAFQKPTLSSIFCDEVCLK